MKMQKRLRALVFTFVLVFAAFVCYAENVTVSTYYPSPYGSYQSLDAVNLSTTGATNLATAGGNVGIGTTAPVTKLDVVGDITLSGRLRPFYDSGWRFVTSGDTVQFLMGGILTSAYKPSLIQLLQCGAISGDDCVTEMVISGTHGYQDGGSAVNPVRIVSGPTNSAAASRITVYTYSGWWAWGYWTPLVWHCPGDADGNCFTAYYRLLVWR